MAAVSAKIAKHLGYPCCGIDAGMQLIDEVVVNQDERVAENQNQEIVSEWKTREYLACTEMSFSRD